jgi:RNA polymerase-binding transcription factor DksA
VVAKPIVKKNVKPAAKKVAPKPVVKKVEAKIVAKKQENKPAVKKVVQQPVVKPVTPKVEAKKPTPVQQAVTTKKTEVHQPEPVKIERPTMRYSDEELKEFKVLIDKKLESAREELKYLKDSLDNHTDSQAGNKAWNMEEGTDTSEMETLMNQISRQHTYIRNLELALVRIENKTYGVCRQSGNLIPKERLRIVPHATLSLEAKMNRKVDDESPAANILLHRY